jgi:hypothetical protein
MMDAREKLAAHATGRDERVIGSNLPDDLSQQGFPVIFPSSFRAFPTPAVET